MEKKDWSNVGEEIKKAFNSVDWDGLDRQLGDAVNHVANETKRMFGQGASESKQEKQWKQDEPDGRARRQSPPPFPQKKATQSQSQRMFIPFTKKGNAEGNIMVVLGWIGIVLFGIPEIVFTLFLPADSVFLSLFLSFGVVIAGCIALVYFGNKRLRLYRHSLRYLGLLEDKGYCMIKNVSDCMGMTEEQVRNEWKKLLQNGAFPQGAMDRAETCMIGNQQCYEMYQQAQRDYEQRSTQTQQEAPKETNFYVEELRRATVESTDQDFVQRAQRLLVVVEQILKYVDEHPAVLEDTNRFMNYYLPTTMKLVHTFRQLEQQPLQGDNIQKTKNEIKQTLVTVAEAFETLLNGFYEAVNLDVSSDISVLNTMIAKEGWNKGDFDLK